MMTFLLFLVCVILLPFAVRAFVATLPIFLVAFGCFAVVVAVFMVWALATAPHDSQKSFAQQRYENEIALSPTPAPIQPEKSILDRAGEFAAELKPAPIEQNDPSAIKARGAAELERYAQSHRDFNAQWLKEAQAVTQRWNESQ